MSDHYRERMVSARDSRAVLKMRIANLRAASPNVPIVALEGVDDKFAYYQWFRRFHANFSYEPFTCGGKKRVLDLKLALDADRNGLRRNVYFFIDRDYDDMQGHAESDVIFMTDAYSVENYLVSRSVIEEILKHELHCDGHPQLRTQIALEFQRRYEEFLATTEPLNRRIFIARRLGIKVVGGISQRASDLATITLDKVTNADIAAHEAITLEREPTEQEVQPLMEEFEKLAPQLRYRGKFALAFMFKWLELLSAERRECINLFAGMACRAKINLQELTITSLASKSAVPIGLPGFLDRLVSNQRVHQDTAS